MKCKDFQENLFAYAENELPEGVHREMDQHALDCKACAKLQQGFRAIEKVIGEEKAIEPNPFIATRLLTHVMNPKQNQPFRIFPVLRPVLVTLGLLIAMLTGFLVGNHGVSRKVQPRAENQQIEILKAEFYVQDFVDEDISLLNNN